jgi:hypothetical protein
MWLIKAADVEKIIAASGVKNLPQQWEDNVNMATTASSSAPAEKIGGATS